MSWRVRVAGTGLGTTGISEVNGDRGFQHKAFAIGIGVALEKSRLKGRGGDGSSECGACPPFLAGGSSGSRAGSDGKYVENRSRTRFG